MNICFYTDYAINPRTGGIGKVSAILAEYFQNAFHWKVYSIYAFDNEDATENTEVAGSTKLRLHDRLGLRNQVRRNIPLAARFLKDNNIDVLIVQTSLDIVAKLRPHTKAHIISVLHFEPGRDEWKWEHRPFARLRNFLVHQATVKAYRNAYQYGDKVFVLSPSYIQKYIDYASLPSSSKLAALPNPIAPAADSDIAKQKTILVVARMEEKQKRISLILRYWQSLMDEGWKLQIVGDGPSLNKYKAMAEEMQLRNVEFLGRQNPIPFYQSASIFLMTSSFEGFPMTIVESQQYGCVPVVFDSFAAIHDVVNNGQDGIIVPNNNDDGYISAIRSLMENNALREQMSAEAEGNVVRFHTTNICEEWRQIIEDL